MRHLYLKIKNLSQKSSFIFIGCLGLAGCALFEPKSELQPTNTLEIKGADLSFLPEIRQSKLSIRNANGQVEDMLTTFKKAGGNVVRLRLWHSPKAPTSSLASVKALAKEVQGLGMKVLLSVHYSDDWADPQKQVKPAKWEKLDFKTLQDSVYQYTRKAVREIAPEYIQVGNEINEGILWPEGAISKLSQMRLLLKQGIQAVRDQNPNTKIVLHYAGHQGAVSFFNNLSDLDFDLIGLSYYPNWHGKSLADLQSALQNLAQTFHKPLFIAETSYPFTLGWNDWTNNIIGEKSQILAEFEPTPDGQKAFLNKLKAILAATPKGIGFCYWGAEWVSYKGNQASDGSTWENQALWDFDKKALPALDIY